MQEIITYIIGIIVAFMIGRWIWGIIKLKDGGGCSSCDCCSKNHKCDCD